MPRRPPDARQMSKTAYAEAMGRERRRLEDLKRRGAPIVDEENGPYVEHDTAAELLQLTPGYVRVLCRQGKLGHLRKVYRHGFFKRSILLIPKTEISRYLQENYKLTAPKVFPTRRPPRH